MNTDKNIVEKTYTYTYNGKPRVVKRKYAVDVDRINKNNELDEYFKYNLDEIKSSKRLKDVFDDYLSNHSKISFGKFYLKYRAVFGRRRTKEPNNDETEEEETIL